MILQRLEFLGDALLDYYVVRYIHDKYLHLGEGGLTNLKGTMVANTALGALSEVLDLPKFIALGSEPLRLAIDAYVADVADLRKAMFAKPAAEREPYWQDLNPPKACADIVEALIGAMLVDSDFDVAPGQAFFDERIKPWLETYCVTDPMAAHNPATFVALVREKGCQAFRIEIADASTTRAEAARRGGDRQSSTLAAGGAPPSGVRCRFWLHDTLVSEASHPSRKSAILASCRIAVRKLEANEWQLLADNCTCRGSSKS